MSESAGNFFGDECLEAARVRAVASMCPVCLISAKFEGESDAAIADLLQVFADAGISLDMVSCQSLEGKAQFRCVIPDDDLASFESVLNDQASRHSCKWSVTRDLAKIGAVGDGFLSDSSMVANIHRTLIQAGIEPIETTVSALRVTLLIPKAGEADAVRVIHRLCV